MEKTVTRLMDGSLLKGYLKDFSPKAEEILVQEEPGGSARSVKIKDVKAVFFVKSFEGDEDHRERKSYSMTRTKGQRVFVKFRDGESLLGFLEGATPWDKGFFLSRRDNSLKGFFLLPADEDANNDRVFVVSSSVDDVTVVPGQADR
jgi:hypothetical protein